jgi:hypothetical protein
MTIEGLANAVKAKLQELNDREVPAAILIDVHEAEIKLREAEVKLRQFDAKVRREAGIP